MSEQDAVKLAKAIDSLPYLCTQEQMLVLARAVIAQNEELERVRRVAADLTHSLGREQADSRAARAVVAEQGAHIATLKAALREALDGWHDERENEGLAPSARIVELRRLV